MYSRIKMFYMLRFAWKFLKEINFIYLNVNICYSTNWNPVGSRILLVEIGILICTELKPV